MNKTSPQHSPSSSKKRVKLIFLIIGCLAIFYGVQQRPPALDKLLPVTAQVTKVATVSERLKNNEAAAPSSINPFESHDWIELTVKRVSPPSNDSTPSIWKINATLAENDLTALIGTRVTGLAKDLNYRSEVFELKKGNGDSLVSYFDAAAAGNNAFRLFTILGAVLLVISLILFVVQRKPQTA